MESLKDLSDLIPILFFLLPGFVSAGIVEMLAVRKRRDTFARTVEAFIFTIINLVCFVVIRTVIEQLTPAKFNKDNFLTAGNLSLLAFCAIGIGLLWSFELTNEHLFEFLRTKLRVTNRTSKPSTWLETFTHAEKFVVVHLADERRIFGWPRFYSDDRDERAIFLEEASWLDENNGLLNDPPISILLDKESGIKLIEFLDT